MKTLLVHLCAKYKIADSNDQVIVFVVQESDPRLQIGKVFAEDLADEDARQLLGVIELLPFSTIKKLLELMQSKMILPS
jgi:hypothetical protein